MPWNNQNINSNHPTTSVKLGLNTANDTHDS